MRYVTLAERPDLVTAMWRMGNDWPEFLHHDPLGDIFFGRLPEVFPHWQQLLLDDDGAVVGKVNAIPFPWDGTDDDLPDGGWAAVMERGFAAQRRGIPATAVSLPEARLVPAQLARGRSREMLEAMGVRAVTAGLPDLFGPVRPTHKARGAVCVDGRLRLRDPRRRAAGRPVAAGPRAHGRSDRQGRAVLDGHPGDAGGVAGVDGPAVRREG